MLAAFTTLNHVDPEHHERLRKFLFCRNNGELQRDSESINLLPEGTPSLKEWEFSACASAMDWETMSCQTYVVLRHRSTYYLGTLNFADSTYLPVLSIEAPAQAEGIEQACQILDGPTLILQTAASQFLVVHRHGLNLAAPSFRTPPQLVYLLRQRTADANRNSQEEVRRQSVAAQPQPLPSSDCLRPADSPNAPCAPDPDVVNQQNDIGTLHAHSRLPNGTVRRPWLAHLLTIESGQDREVQPLLWQADQGFPLQLWTCVRTAKPAGRARRCEKAQSVPQRSAHECSVVSVTYTGAMKQPLWRAATALPLPLPEHPAPGRSTPSLSSNENCSPNLSHNNSGSALEHALPASRMRGAFPFPLPKPPRQAFVGPAALIRKAAPCRTGAPSSRAQAATTAECPASATTPTAVGTETGGAALRPFQLPHPSKTGAQGPVTGPWPLTRAAERSQTCLVVETAPGDLQFLDLPPSVEACSTAEPCVPVERPGGVQGLGPHMGRARADIHLPCRVSSITFHRSALGGIATDETWHPGLPASLV